MPGKGSEKRTQLTSMKAAKMAREGRRYKEISDATGIPTEQLKARIALGERLLSIETEGKSS